MEVPRGRCTGRRWAGRSSSRINWRWRDGRGNVDWPDSHDTRSPWPGGPPRAHRASLSNVEWTMVYSRECIASVFVGSSAFYIAQPLQTHHTYWVFASTFWRMVDVSWSVTQMCGSSFPMNMETTTFFSYEYETWSFFYLRRMVDVRRSAVQKPLWRYFERVETRFSPSAKWRWRSKRNRRFPCATSDTLLLPIEAYDLEFGVKNLMCSMHVSFLSSLSGQLNLAITGSMLLMFMAITSFSSAAQILSNISCATNPYWLAAKLTFFWTDDKIFLACCEAPSGPWRASNRFCPGTGHKTKCTMVSVPLWASTALQSAVSLWEIFTLLKR